MTPDAVRELWVRFVAGEALPAGDQAALVAALEADAALRAELLEDVQFDGALRAMGDARRSGAAFAASLGACLEPERDATRFVRKVEARLADLPPEPAGSRRESRSNLPRISRRYHRRDSASAGWRSALAAAGAFIAILALATAFGSKAPPMKPSKKDDVGIAPSPPPKMDEGVSDRREPAPRIRREDPAPLPPAKEEEEEGRARFVTPEEREAIEKLMREVIENGKRGLGPKPAPAPEKTPGPPPATPPSTRAEGVAALERPVLEKVVKDVYVGRSKERVPQGSFLDLDQDLWVSGGSSQAVLRYADGTSLKVEANSVVRDISDVRGRRVLLGQGSIVATVAVKTADRPMVFVTAQAQAVAHDAVLWLSTDRKDTSLEVKKGKARLTRASGDAAVEVVAGSYATSGDPTSRVAFPEEFVMNFGPADTQLGAGELNDAGEPFDAKRGYGWEGPKDGELLGTWQGQSKFAGRAAILKGDPALVGWKKATAVVAGWGAHSETWKIKLPNGRYLVTACVGDPTYEQGPHRVQIQDKFPILDEMTRETVNGGFLERTLRVQVKDGELILKLGGCKGKASDGSSDSILNYAIIKRVSAQ